MNIQEIYYVMHVGKTNNDAKVSLHVSEEGVRWLCIHKRRFTDIESALSYLREDARSIMAPELRPAYFKQMGMLAEMKKAEADLGFALAEAA